MASLTRFLLSVSLARLPEAHHCSEIGPQHSPAEGSHRVNPDQATDEGVLAAFQKGNDVRPHVICVLLPEILHRRHARTGLGMEEKEDKPFPYSDRSLYL